MADSDAVLGYGSGIYPEPYTGSGDGWAQPGSLARSFELKPAATPFAAAEAAAPLVKRVASAASASAAEAAKTSACASSRLAGRSRLAEAGIYIYLGGSDAEVQALSKVPRVGGGSPKPKRDRAASASAASAASAAKRSTAAAAATASAAASAAKAIKERTGWDPMEHAAAAAAATAAAAAAAASATAAAAAAAAAAQREAPHPTVGLEPPFRPRAAAIAASLGEGAPAGHANGASLTERAKGPRYQRAADILLGEGNGLLKDSQLADPAAGYGVRAASPPGSCTPRAARLGGAEEMEAEASLPAATTRRGNSGGAAAEAAAEAKAPAEAAEAEAEGVASLLERMAAGQLLSSDEMARLREAEAAEAAAEAAAVAQALALAETMAEAQAEAEEEAGMAAAVKAAEPRKYLHAQRLALSIMDDDSADVHEIQELRAADAEADILEERRSRRASKEAAYPHPKGRPVSSYSTGVMGSTLEAADAEAVLGMLRGLRIFQDLSDDALKAVMARACVRTPGRSKPGIGQGVRARAQVADRPRLAGARGSLGRALVLGEATGEPVGCCLSPLALDTGAHLPALLGGGA